MENFDFQANYPMDELHHLYPGHGTHPPVDQLGDKQNTFDFQTYMLANQSMGNSMNSASETQQEMLPLNQQHTQFETMMNEGMNSMHSSGMNDSFARHNMGQYHDPQQTTVTEMPDLSNMDTNLGYAMHNQLTEQDGNQLQLSSNSHVNSGQNLLSQKPYSTLESSAITPASVFSTVSSASTNDFLSPITSPMLQPQAGQASMFGLGDNEMRISHEMLNGNPTSPAHSFLNRENTTAYTQSFSSLMKNNASRSSVASPMSPLERPVMRRARTGDKTGRIRPSPLMKPIQSPKSGSTNLIWNASKRDNNSHSPALGAIESLSSTMHDANPLVMPSPSFSPAMIPLNGHGGSQVPDSATRSHSVDEFVMSPTVKRDNPSELSNSGRGSLNSPSPIDLAQNEYRGSPSGQTVPATPGTIMGLVNSSSQHSQSLTPQEHESPSVAQSSSTLAQESSQNNTVYPSTQVPPISEANKNSKVISSLQAQDAVHAVATSAMVNAAQARSNLMYMAPHHKTILPGGLSLDDRNAWLNVRRVGHGLDQRRTSHKAAEQKRRDSLKCCFDELRTLLPPITVDDSVPGGSILGPDGSSEDRLAEGFDSESNMKATSSENEPAVVPSVDLSSEQARDANRAVAKVLLLRHSNEYLIRLKRRIERRDLAVQSLSEEVVRLRALLADAEKRKGDGVEAKVSSELSSLSIQQKGHPADVSNQQSVKVEVKDKA